MRPIGCPPITVFPDQKVEDHVIVGHNIVKRSLIRITLENSVNNGRSPQPANAFTEKVTIKHNGVIDNNLPNPLLFRSQSNMVGFDSDDFREAGKIWQYTRPLLELPLTDYRPLADPGRTRVSLSFEPLLPYRPAQNYVRKTMRF